MNPSNVVAVYDYSIDEDDEAESVTITDAMTPSDVIAALVDAFGEAIRQRVKAQRMRKVIK